LSAEEALNRVGQKGGHTYIWAKVGSRPPMIRDNRHDSAYIFGAICPDRAVGAAIIAPAANTECMSDRARGYLGADLLKVQVPLPPYSPELNPMENVWGIPARQQALRPCLLSLSTERDVLSALSDRGI
jgi:hypothetical protein